MLSPKQIQEIQEILERSQNPLFFYDNDADGLCSYLILKRALTRGKGVTIKSFPDLNQQYNHKIDELKPDLIVILDKAELSPNFANHAEYLGIPILWIDHHQSKTPKEVIEKTSYFTSYPTAEPTSYIAQKIFNRPQDLWLSTIGCIADVYMPDFATKISKQFPELLPQTENPFKALQSSDLGKIARILNFSLMDTTTHIQQFTNYLAKATSPQDILEENQYTKQAHSRFNQLNDFLQKQIQKAEQNTSSNSKILFHTYSGNTSMSSEISNLLAFRHPNKTIIVAFLRPEKANISIRGKNALTLTKQLLQNIPDSTGGGHTEATGAMVPIEHFEKFKQNIPLIS
jgi:single-stranded DNA-specific DHH superfamily exonuclease